MSEENKGPVVQVDASVLLAGLNGCAASISTYLRHFVYLREWQNITL